MNDVTLQFLARDLWIWALVLIPALCLAFWAYHRILAPLSVPARITLWLLRGLAFALVIFALWQPTLSYRIPDTGRPRIAMLVDRSGSMSLPASEPGFSDRGDEARTRAREVAEELGDGYALEWFDFGARIEPSVRDSSTVSEGPTSIGGALEEVLVRSAAQPVHGIFLVSDGVNTLGRDPVRVAKGSPVPIFAVPVGPHAALPDLEIRRVQTNNRAFAGEPLPIEVVISSSGLEGEVGTIEIRADGEILEEREFEVLGDRGLEQSLRFETQPDRPGWIRYEVRARVGNDAVPENDVREIAVEVMERKTRVLVVSDAIDWDFGFLRQTFDADTTLGYAYLVRTQGGNYRGSGNKPPNELPTRATALEEYAAVVLVSSGSDALPERFLESVGEFVSRGGGLWILGGPPPSGANWSDVDRFQRMLPARVVNRAGGGPTLSGVELLAQGMRHPITALRDNPSQTAALFASLPPIWSTGLTLEPKGNGRELLAFGGIGPGRTALIAGFGDRGKVVWLAGRGLWRWRLTAAGSDLPPQLFADFALGTIRWLAEPAIRDRFQVEPGRRVYPNGESVSFLANLWDPSLQPIEGASIVVEIVADSANGEGSQGGVDRAGSGDAGSRDAGSSDAGGRGAGSGSAGNAAGDGTPGSGAAGRGPNSGLMGTTPGSLRIEMEPSGESGTYEGHGPGLAPGTYRYRAHAVGGTGSDLGVSEGTFWVESMGPEFARIVSDRETLRQIAEESAGQVVESASLAQLVDRIPDAIRRVGRVREVDLWNHWALFALFVLLLSTEWFLRRRRGLA